MAGFEDLDNDTLILILDYLGRERSTILQGFRLLSSRLKHFSDALANRSISLIDDEIHEQITYRLVERLTDPSDELCHYVRNLHFFGFKGDANSFCLNSSLILECLRHVQRLDSFSWSCDAPIPSKLLDCLHQRFPCAQLCANVRLSSQALLCIPRLHRLEVTIPCEDSFGDYSVSLYRAAKHALFQLSSLRHLCLDTHRDVNVQRFEDAALDRLHLPLQPGDKLPSLHLLDLQSKNYVFDLDHCKLLLASLDCSTLRSLAVSSNSPISLFAVLAANLTLLEHLSISHASSPDDPRHFLLRECSTFMSGLMSLKSLVLHLDDLDMRSDFSRMLMRIHGPSLLHLTVRARHHDVVGPIYHGNTRRFLFKFTNLQSLSLTFIDIRSYHRCDECEGREQDGPSRFSFVPPLPSLRDIDLCVRVPTSDRPFHTYINKHAHCSIHHLWTSFANKPNSQLENLSIRFWRWESNGRQTRLTELIYDASRLRRRITVKVRHRRDIPVIVYEEVLEDGSDRKVLVAVKAP